MGWEQEDGCGGGGAEAQKAEGGGAPSAEVSATRRRVEGDGACR